MLLETGQKDHDAISEQSYPSLCRAGWAWEWLRRNADYCQQSENRKVARLPKSSLPSNVIVLNTQLCHRSEGWGLCLLEDSNCPYTTATVFWQPHVDVSVLGVAVVPLDTAANPTDVFDLSHISASVTVLKFNSGGEHVLIGNGLQSIQLHVVDGTVLDGPVRVAHLVSGMANLQHHFRAVERFTALRDTGRIPLQLFPQDPRAPRWRLALKALDMERDGASLSDISQRLYNHAIGRAPQSGLSDWPRSRVRRLLALAHSLTQGGYRRILQES